MKQLSTKTFILIMAVISFGLGWMVANGPHECPEIPPYSRMTVYKCPDLTYVKGWTGGWDHIIWREDSILYEIDSANATTTTYFRTDTLTGIESAKVIRSFRISKKLAEDWYDSKESE